MIPALYRTDIEDAFDFFIEEAVHRVEELYHLDGETAFRRHGGHISTWALDFDPDA